MLKDEEQAITKEATKIGCFFVIKQGRIIARIKKGCGRGEADSNKTNELAKDKLNKSAYGLAKEYETELLQDYQNKRIEIEMNECLSDLNTYNGYKWLLIGDNMDYLTA